MMRRLLGSAATLLAAAFTTAAAQNPPRGAPTPDQGQGQRPAAAQAEGPKAYRDVITTAAVTDSGVFIVHKVGEKLYYEIPRRMLGRDFLLVVDRRGTARGVGYAGEETVSRTVRWDRLGSRVFLRMTGFDMQADSNLPVSRAVRLSNEPQILRSFDIAAWSPDDSNAVIEVTPLFTQDVPEINARQDLGRRVRRFDPARSAIERYKSFPRNVEVSVYQTYEVDSLPGAPGSRADGSINSVTLLMNYSMVLLPDQPMMPRLCDNRVGYFSQTFEDFGRDQPRVALRCFIARWRLDPVDPNAAVSDVRNPIVFYLDPATPDRWVPWIIRGVEAWQPVFEAAGLRRAIVARRAPTPQEDPQFDLDDARYSTVRWLPSTIENAYGPSTVDPRSGEILQSNIGWFQNITSLLQAWYWVQAGAVDPRVTRFPFPDSLMGQMVAYVATHEVGHTLGLPHAMLSSWTYPTDSLRSRTFTCRYGTTASIMDYARNNYVAQPGDNACLMPTIGPYDYFVINWGYRHVPGATNPDAERPFLDSLARQQDANPMFRYGRQGDATDPRVQSEALGDDPVRSTGYGLQNLRRLVPMLIPATTANVLEDYTLLNDTYGRIIFQWGLEMGHVAVVPGGVWRQDKYPDQAGVIYTDVPRAKQQEAVRFLLDNAFTTPTWLLDTAVLRRIEPTGSVERIRARQTAVLNTLLQDARLSRMVEQAAFATPGSPAYTLAEFFGDLRRGLFSEVTAGRNPDEYRRNIQRAFVEGMDRIINTPLTAQVPPNFPNFPGFTPPPPRPADAVALARQELRDLDASLRTAILRTTDRTTRAHYQQLRDRIQRVLNPPA